MTMEIEEPPSSETGRGTDDAEIFEHRVRYRARELCMRVAGSEEKRTEDSLH